MEKNLAQWLTYLEQLHPSEIDMGLQRIQSVAERMQLQKPAKQVVVVTGTNGKGSTCAFLSALIQSQGKRVGVYSSPHMLVYNERVTVQGEHVADAQLCKAFAAVEQAREGVTLTYFEVGTLAALWVFAQADLDVAILEVGLGGRLDAVNIVDADISIITSVAVDHEDWLGSTRESVGFEKAGIFRAKQTALCGDAHPPSTVLEQAVQLATNLSVIGNQFGFSDVVSPEQNLGQWSAWVSDKQGQVIHFQQLPAVSLPKSNLILALQAYYALGFSIADTELSQRLSHFVMPGRLQKVQVKWQGKKTVNLLLDVAHNPHAAEFLAVSLAKQRPSGRLLALLGLMKDKDLQGVITPLIPLIDQWMVTTLPGSRAQQASQIAQKLQQQNISAVQKGTVAEALESLCAAATDQDLIVVFGSFFTVSAALEWLASSK